MLEPEKDSVPQHQEVQEFGNQLMEEQHGLKLALRLRFTMYSILLCETKVEPVWYMLLLMEAFTMVFGMELRLQVFNGP